MFILIFFTVYAASCFLTCGKLFSTLFDLPYIPMMILGAVFVLAYTILGGFLAESASDFMQAIVMIIALIAVVIVGTVTAGGFFHRCGGLPYDGQRADALCTLSGSGNDEPGGGRIASQPSRMFDHTSRHSDGKVTENSVKFGF